MLRRWMRWVLIGRTDGLRARIRRRFGVFRTTPSEGASTDLDRAREADPARAPVPPSPVPAAQAPPPEAVPDGWVRVLSADELAPGEVVEVLAGERPVALANVDGAFHAVDSTCPHAGGPLGDGHLDGPTLTCPWHGWSYDVRTGRSLVDATVCVAVRPVKVVHGGVYVPSE